jgi:hypothetical protein
LEDGGSDHRIEPALDRPPGDLAMKKRVLCLLALVLSLAATTSRPVHALCQITPCTTVSDCYAACGGPGSTYCDRSTHRCLPF